MSEWQIISVEDGLFKYVRRGFMAAGMDDFTDPPAQDPDSFALLNNVIAGARSRLTRRWGTTLFSNPEMDARRIYETHFSNGRDRTILTAADGTGAAGPDNRIAAINNNGGLVTTVPILTPSSSASHPVICTSRNYMFITDGRTADLKMWDTHDTPTATTASPTTGALIPSVTNWGIATPVPAGAGGAMDATASAESAAGNINLVGGRAYTVIYRNSLGGITSSIAPFTGRMGITTDPTDDSVGVSITLTNIPISGDPQVDQRVILATADGGAQDTLYEVTIINDNSTTSYVDNLAEGDLTSGAIWNERGTFGEVGCINNTPPFETCIDTTHSGVTGSAANGPKLCCVFRGRLIVALGHHIFFSKNQFEVTTQNTVAGRWETCFPVRNQVPISSNGAEVCTSLRTDDTRCYIGTNRAVYILDSDNPGLNPPRALFQEVGVLNDAVWQTIYHEGHAVGAVWVTPDHRVIYSNFETYKDRGRAIQTTLNNLSSSIVTTATSTFIADAEHEFYMLAPGGSSLNVLILNVKTGKWFKWFSPFAADFVRCIGYTWDATNIRPLPLFAVPGQQLYRWNKATVQDHSSGTTGLSRPAIQTNWLDFGDPTVVKYLNSVEIQTDEPSATLDVQGANSEDDFDVPTDLVTARAFTANIFGELTASLADVSTRHRFYRFGFGGFDNSTETDILSYIGVEFARGRD